MLLTLFFVSHFHSPKEKKRMLQVKKVSDTTKNCTTLGVFFGNSVRIPSTKIICKERSFDLAFKKV
jgi:hypothetical protein